MSNEGKKISALIKAIDELLPQTQCEECGYKGCLPYAEALAQGIAPINRCPPGGPSTVNALAALLSIDASPFLSTAKANRRLPALATIRESECIGCTKCIQACPVDAIIGAAKRMHTIIKTECTGCGLCVDPCPVDCIEMVAIPEPTYDRARARQRFNERQTRLIREEQEKQALYREKRKLALKTVHEDLKAKQNYIQEALARVKTKKKINE